MFQTTLKYMILNAYNSYEKLYKRFSNFSNSFLINSCDLFRNPVRSLGNTIVKSSTISANLQVLGLCVFFFFEQTIYSRPRATSINSNGLIRFLIAFIAILGTCPSDADVAHVFTGHAHTGTYAEKTGQNRTDTLNTDTTIHHIRGWCCETYCTTKRVD